MTIFNEAGDGVDLRKAIESDDDAYPTALEALNDVIQGALHAGSMGKGAEELVFVEIRIAVRTVLENRDMASLAIIE